MINEKKYPYDMSTIRRSARQIALLKKERERCIIWIPGKDCYMSCDVTQISRKKSLELDVYRLVGFCICNKAESVIMMHNHPDDRCWASPADIFTSNSLKEQLQEYNIKLLDALIITSDDMWSIAEHNWEYVEPRVFSEEYKNRKKTKVFTDDY